MKSTRNRSRLADQGTKEMLPVIFSLAWPTMLEQLMQTAVQYMDTGMVGVLGTSATAAVGATSTVNWLIGSTISAISIGFLAYISNKSFLSFMFILFYISLISFKTVAVSSVPLI